MTRNPLLYIDTDRVLFIAQEIKDGRRQRFESKHFSFLDKETFNKEESHIKSLVMPSTKIVITTHFIESSADGKIHFANRSSLSEAQLKEIEAYNSYQ